MKTTTLSDGEMISMSILAAASRADTADSYFAAWLQLCAKLQQDKIVSAARTADAA
jgi:hypothetical protein